MSEILSYMAASKRRPEKPRDLSTSPQKAAQTPPSPSLDDPGVFEVEETPQKVAKKSKGHSMVAPPKQASKLSSKGLSNLHRVYYLMQQ